MKIILTFKSMVSFEKVLDLIKKTGDKGIVLDESGDPKYVIMSFFDYEKFVEGRSEVKGLTEDELLAKINRDIEIWKGSHKDSLPLDQYDFSTKLEKEAEKSLNLEEEEDRYYFEPVE